MMFPRPLCVILTIGEAAIPSLEVGPRFRGNDLIPCTLLLAVAEEWRCQPTGLCELGRLRPFVEPRNASRVTTLVLT